MRDWNFEQFFPNGSARNSLAEPQRPAPPVPGVITGRENGESPKISSSGIQKSRSGIFGFGKRNAVEDKPNLEERVKSEIFSNNVRNRNNDPFVNNLQTNGGNSGHKRQDSDSRISLNFVRGFRRENTDFFPLSKRHSAVLGENLTPKQIPAPQVPLRSSAIFRRNQNKGEPVLTDYTNHVAENDILRQKTPPQHQKSKQQPLPSSSSSFVKNLDFLRPRREKTESVILVKNTAARQLYAQQHQVNINELAKEMAYCFSTITQPFIYKQIINQKPNTMLIHGFFDNHLRYH